MTRRLGTFRRRSPVEVHCRIHDSLTGADPAALASRMKTRRSEAKPR